MGDVSSLPGIRAGYLYSEPAACLAILWEQLTALTQKTDASKDPTAGEFKGLSDLESQ